MPVPPGKPRAGRNLSETGPARLGQFSDSRQKRRTSPYTLEPRRRVFPNVRINFGPISGTNRQRMKHAAGRCLRGRQESLRQESPRRKALGRKGIMKSRKTQVLVVMAILLGAAALVLFLRNRSADRVLALLEFLPPDADLYVMADLASLQGNPAVRRFLSDPPQVSVEEDYKRFVEAAGFRYQDDLKQLALANLGLGWVGAARVRIDRPRILRYLESENAEKSEEQGQTIFVFGQSRPFRLVLLERDLALFTVGGDATLIRSALQRYLGKGSGSGAEQLRKNADLSRLPKGSALRVVGRMDRLLDRPEWQARFGAFEIGRNLLRGSKTLYASVRSGLTQLDFHVEDRCESATAAERIAKTLRGLLMLLQPRPSDKADPTPGKLTALLANISVEQVQDSVFLQWQWDRETLRKIE